jgi:NAD(P)-dependent dehydrogenase (short-subunit alcohol dehydrogenase family)
MVPPTKRNSRVLSGKSVLITGAAKRIGRACALAMAEAGADVAITYLSSRTETEKTTRDIANFGVRVLAVRCDVRNEKSIRAAVKKVAGEFGRLDILVNNAAFYETAEIDEITVAQWDNMFATNTRGPFLVSRACVPELRKRRGRIINIGSLGGLRPWTSHAHYCQSKAALHMQTQVMAKAFAPEIVVNCVSPGLIDSGQEEPNGFMKKMAEKTPMRRNGTAADVAAAVMMMATAPDFITGQILAVDGGLELV